MRARKRFVGTPRWRALVVGGALVMVGASACTFETTWSTEAGDGPDEEDGGVEDEPTAVAPCKTPDARGLVVCFEFEDSVSDGVLDDSSPARRNAQSTGIAQVPRDASASSMAADVGPMASTYVVQDAAAFELAGAYTLAAWVKPDSVPGPSSARGLFDHEGQYAMIVSATASGAINNRCQHTGVAKYEFTERLPVGQWSFMACTWDGTELCAWRWASPTDHERYCHTPAFPPANTGTKKGLAIGHLSSGGSAHSRFDGALDSVQVYARGMTEAQLCALAGQPAGCMPCDAGCL